MTDQIQEAKDWLGDLSKIVSQQKTKEDYDYTKKRTDSLGWLINRVEELEEQLTNRYGRGYKQGRFEEQLENYENTTLPLMAENQRYKQALEYAQSELEYAHVTGNMELKGELIKKALKSIDEALKGESQ